jgi:ABC-2 type transport system permease protein
MHKVWVVMRREFVERVRNKWFVISTVVGPLVMAVFIFLPFILAESDGGHRSVVVVDLTSDEFGLRVTNVFSMAGSMSVSRLTVQPDRLTAVGDSLAGLVGMKDLDGFLIVTDTTVEAGQAEYRGSNVSSLTDMRVLERLLREVVLVERLKRVGVDPAAVARAQTPVLLRTVGIRGGRVTEDSGASTFLLGYIMWFILYMAILLYGLQVMGSVVEEKNSRVIEVLVSSLRPFQLLAGKVGGVGGVGLFQLLIWGGAARLLLTQRTRLAEVVGLQMGTGQSITLPSIPIDLISVCLLYFLLGYFLYAAMFAAVGAMSSTEAEARQAQTPVVMLLAIPAIMLIAVLDNPDGSLAVVLSLVPFSSPIAMPVRWAATEVPLIELGLSVALVGFMLVATTWLAARIYRVGILMYGRRPGLRELVRWVRTP